MWLLTAIGITGVVFAGVFIALTSAGFDNGASLALAGMANGLTAPLHQALKKRASHRMSLSPVVQRLWPVNSYFLNWPTAAVYATTIVWATSSGTAALFILTAFSSWNSPVLRFPEPIVLAILGSVSLLSNLLLAGLAFLLGRRVAVKGRLAVLICAVLTVLYVNNVSRFGLNLGSPEQVAVLYRLIPLPEFGDWFINWLLPLLVTLAIMLPFHAAGARGRNAAFLRYAFWRMPEEAAAVVVQLVADESQRVGAAAARSVRPTTKPSGYIAWLCVAGGLGVAAALIGAGHAGAWEFVLVLGVYAWLVWLCAALAIGTTVWLPTRGWVEVEPAAMAYHPLNNVPVTTWILLLLPVGVAVAIAAAKIGGFSKGVYSLVQGLHAQTPEISDAQALLHALRAIANDDRALFVVGGVLAALIPVGVFAAALVALHRRGAWFPTLYLTGLLLNMVLFDSEYIAFHVGTLGAARISIADIVRDSVGFYQVYLPFCVGYWIWITRSRRLNLIMRHCVRHDDPLVAPDGAPPDLLRQRTIARTSLAFARLPRDAQNDVIALILEEVRRRAPMLRRRVSKPSADAGTYCSPGPTGPIQMA
jgi:hypothetical protein